MIDLAITHRGYSGEKLNDFFGRGRRTPQPGGLQYASYHRRLRTPGGWEIGFNEQDDRVLLIEPYHIMEFWLRDRYGGMEYQRFLNSLPAYRKDAQRPNWYLDHTGLVLTEPTITQQQDGTYTMQVRGRGLNEFLASEYIDFAPGTSEAEKSGVAETVAKAYVNENIGPGAGTDAGGKSRVRVGLTVEASAGSGGTWQGDRSRELLSDVVRELADVASGPGDYMIEQVGDAAFEFQWRAPHWGLDKRLGNGVRRPVLFASSQGNVQNMVSSVSYLRAVSGVIAYGQGLSNNLKPGTAYDATLTTTTSWARKVVLRNAGRDAVTQAALDDSAYAELYRQRPETTVETEVLTILSCRYNVHWKIGDLCTVQDTWSGRQVDRKIVGAWVSLPQDGNVSIIPDFGDFIDA